MQNNVISNAPGVGVCINSSGANSATYEGNNCSGGWVGFYNDSYGNTNVTVVNNQFVGMSSFGLCMGVSETGLHYPGIINLVISGNLFCPTSCPPSTGIGINDYSPNQDKPIENVTITNNTIEFQGTSPTGQCCALNLYTDNYAQGWPPDYFWNCYIGYNTIQTNVGQYYVNNQLGMQQWTVDHNTDQNGVYLCQPYWPTNGTYTTYTRYYFKYP